MAITHFPFIYFLQLYHPGLSRFYFDINLFETKVKNLLRPEFTESTASNTAIVFILPYGLNASFTLHQNIYPF